MDSIIEFEVLEDGLLRVAGFKDAKIRAEFYYDIADCWENSPKDLAQAMVQCQPLAWEVYRIYDEMKEEVEYELEDAEHELKNLQEILDDEKGRDKATILQEIKSYRKKIAALKHQLASMSEDSEEGATKWMRSLDDHYFREKIVEKIREWFSEEPDWAFEQDYLPETETGQGAALEFFRDMDSESRELLCVKVIEGEFPGSTYYAAELRCEIEKANAAAEKAVLPVRFILKKG